MFSQQNPALNYKIFKKINELLFFQLTFGFSTFLSILGLNFSRFFIGHFGGNALGLAQTHGTFRLLALPPPASLCWQVLG